MAEDISLTTDDLDQLKLFSADHPDIAKYHVQGYGKDQLGQLTLHVTSVRGIDDGFYTPSQLEHRVPSSS